MEFIKSGYFYKTKNGRIFVVHTVSDTAVTGQIIGENALRSFNLFGKNRHSPSDLELEEEIGPNLFPQKVNLNYKVTNVDEQLHYFNDVLDMFIHLTQ